MSPGELQAIRDRLSRATPGPWHADGCVLWVEGVGYEADSIGYGPEGEPMQVYGEPYPQQEQIGSADTPETAEFIAAARTDVEQLLALVDSLTAVMEAAEAYVGHAEGEGQCEDRDGNRYDQPSVCADDQPCRENDRRYEALRAAIAKAKEKT